MKISPKLVTAILAIMIIAIAIAIIEAIIYKSFTGLLMGASSLFALMYCMSLLKKLRELE
jgi:hypothetical protein